MKPIIVCGFLIVLSLQIMILSDTSQSDPIESDTDHTDIKLGVNQTYEIIIESRSHMNITIDSDRLIKSKIYTSSGRHLKYKSRLIKLQDKIDHIKIENGDYDNMVRLTMNKIQKNDPDIETVLGLLASIIVIFERKSKYSILILLCLLILRLYNAQLTDVTADRVFKKYIF